MEKRSGVYGFMNLCNGHMYIGSSVNILLRLKRHINALNKGKHINKHLQRAVVKYGGENFKIDVIEFCDEKELHKREQVWIDAFNPEYNIVRVVEKPMLGRSVPKNVRKKISKSLKGREFSDLHRKRLSEAAKRRKPRVGYSHSEETKDKIREKLMGNTNGLGNKAWTGKHHSEETKEKISRTLKARAALQEVAAEREPVLIPGEE